LIISCIGYDSSYYKICPTNSVLVLDNVAYHCIQSDKGLNSAILKKDSVAWLDRMGQFFTYCEKAATPRADTISENKNYLVVDIIKENGHDLLHLPPYHLNLSPFELVWRDIKHRAAREWMSEFEGKQILHKNYLVNT
jgi:hypothetical protein